MKIYADESKKRRGKVIKLADGRLCFMYYDEQTVNGKLLLHTKDGKKIALSNFNNITLVGFFD